jgi:hypothetical protein
MKINQAELDAAIETISEGGTALGLRCEDIYERVYDDRAYMMKFLEDIHSGEGLITYKFYGAFKHHARELLVDALRAKMENDHDL